MAFLAIGWPFNRQLNSANRRLSLPSTLYRAIMCNVYSSSFIQTYSALIETVCVQLLATWQMEPSLALLILVCNSSQWWYGDSYLVNKRIFSKIIGYV